MTYNTGDKRDSSTRFGALWQHADFLKLWIGQSVSLIGSQVTLLALPSTAVFLLKATSWQLGLLSAAESAPFLFLSLFAGVWVDHRRRRPTLIFTNIGRMLLLGLIPILALLGWLRMEELHLIACLVGCLTVFFYLAYQAFLPTLVQRENLVEGNSKFSASQSIAEIGGPGLAGVLVQLMSAPIAIIVDALSFCIAAISLLLMRTPEPLPETAMKARSPLREIGEGLHVTFHNRYLLAFVGEAATYNLFWQVILTVFILYAVRDLHITAGLLGLLFAVGSTGALLGAVLTGRLARRIGVGLTIVMTAALSDIPLLVLPLYHENNSVWNNHFTGGVFPAGYRHHRLQSSCRQYSAGDHSQPVAGTRQCKLSASCLRRSLAGCARWWLARRAHWFAANAARRGCGSPVYMALDSTLTSQKIARISSTRTSIFAFQGAERNGC